MEPFWNSSVTLMNSEQFSLKVQSLRRPTGHSQQELAEALGIQRQVLARKFSGQKAHFTHREIKQLIKTLAEWDAITTTSEAQELLSLMDLPSVSFSDTDWAAFPLAKLQKSIMPPARLVSPLTANPNGTAKLSKSAEPPAQPPFPVTGQFLKTPPANLPVSLTGFIGREWVIRLAGERLLQTGTHLLTLVGPGGIGKTRLSLEIGRRLRDEFNQAVYFVDLSNLTRTDQVLERLAQGLGLEVEVGAEVLTGLKIYLANRRLLVILDNFEHLLPAAGLVSQLLEAVPELKLLVTSRAVLQIYGESQLGIPPLDLPDLDNLPNLTDFAAFLEIEAMQLFVTRAQAVQPNFLLTQANIEEVARLCVLLEGLPLSLELAAARVKLLSLPYLYERLSESKLATLSKGGSNLPARQQTLRATLDWSYGLLAEEARRLFNNLGIFRGSFSLEAVEQICYAESKPPDLLERLGELVDQSLLKTQEGARGEPRFVMLETLREFGMLKLQETGNLVGLQARYGQYYLNLIEKWTVDFKLDPDDQVGLTDLLEQDFDNFQAANYQAVPLVKMEAAKESESEGDPLVNSQTLIKIHHTVIIRRPVEEVFAYVGDFKRWPEWNFLIKEAQPLQPGPYRVGMTIRVKSSILGRHLEQIMIITGYDRDKFIEIKTLKGPFKMVHQFQFSAKPFQTTVTFNTSNNLSQIFRFTRPVLAHIINRGNEIMYNRLKAILEANN